MPENLGDDVHALLVGQDTARHRATDELTVVHKKVPYAEANVVREDGPLVDRHGFDTPSPTLGRGPPVQRGKENGLAGEVQSITAS